MATSYLGRGDLPIGLRNNNPGNIRPRDEWQGMIGTAGGFIVFADLVWGLRALATDLSNKVGRGLDTIRKIVSTYAPVTDKNNVPAYVAAVSRDTGIGADEVIDLDWETLHDLMRGIVTHELGDEYTGYVSDQDIDAGIGKMNDSLLSALQASGLAITTAVENVSNGGAGPRDWLIIAAVVGGAVLFFKN